METDGRLRADQSEAKELLLAQAQREAQIHQDLMFLPRRSSREPAAGTAHSLAGAGAIIRGLMPPARRITGGKTIMTVLGKLLVILQTVFSTVLLVIAILVVMHRTDFYTPPNTPDRQMGEVWVKHRPNSPGQ